MLGIKRIIIYLRNTLVLDFTGMLKSTINNGSQNLRLQQEIPEAAAVNGDIVSLDGAILLSL